MQQKFSVVLVEGNGHIVVANGAVVVFEGVIALSQPVWDASVPVFILVRFSLLKVFNGIMKLLSGQLTDTSPIEAL